MSDEQHQQTN